MAKKDIFTIDTDKASSSLDVFNKVQTSFTTAYKQYQGSYLNTGGDTTVRKLNATVSSFYKEISSLHTSLQSYTKSYINSVQQMEKRLRNLEVSNDKETSANSIINAINELLRGTEPTGIEINPKTGEVLVDFWNNLTRGNKGFNIDPKMNGSLTNKAARDANRDSLVGSFVTNPKSTMFLYNLMEATSVPLEMINMSAYTEQQKEKVKRVKSEYAGWGYAGTGTGIIASILAGGLAGGVKTTAATGAKELGQVGLKQGAKQLFKSHLKTVPIDIAYGIGAGYDVEEGKYNVGKAVGASAGNVLFGLGMEGLFKGAAKGVSSLKKPQIVRIRREVVDDYYYYKNIQKQNPFHASTSAIKDQYYKYTLDKISLNKIHDKMINFYGNTFGEHIDDAISRTKIMTRGEYVRTHAREIPEIEYVMGHNNRLNSYVSVSSPGHSFKDLMVTTIHECNHDISNNFRTRVSVSVGDSQVPAYVSTYGYQQITTVPIRKNFNFGDIDNMRNLGYEINGNNLTKKFDRGFDESVTEWFAQKEAGVEKGRTSYEEGVKALKKLSSLGIPNFNEESIKKGYTNNNISDIFKIRDAIDDVMGKGYYHTKLSPAFDKAAPTAGVIPDSSDINKCINEIAAKLK